MVKRCSVTELRSKFAQILRQVEAGRSVEITRHGKPIAGYYYLPRRPGQKSYRTERLNAGLLVDYNRSGRAIGIEITAPAKISLAKMNRVLRE